MPRLAVKLWGLHLRPEHVAVALVGLAVWARYVAGKVHLEFHFRSHDYLLIFYVALNFLTSGLTSPEPHMTLRWACLNAIVICPYFLIRMLVRDANSLFRALQILLGIGAGEAVYGIICFSSNQLLKTNFGVSGEQYGFIPGTYGTQYEANLFGSYTACCAVMFLAVYLLSSGPGKRKYGLGAVIATLGALVSLSRSVLVALSVTALLVFGLALKRRQLRMRKMVPILAGGVALFLVFSPLITKFVLERISTIDLSDVSSDATTVVRLVQTAAALENVHAHPLLGTGTASFQLFFDWDDYLPGMTGEVDQGGWIGNSPLRVLHDTGIIGLTTLSLFLCSLALSARQAIRVAHEPTKIALITLAVGLALYAITFQATEATILSFTWVHVGLLAAAVEVTRQESVFARGKLIV
jgi:O-antigen ligase